MFYDGQLYLLVAVWFSWSGLGEVTVSGTESTHSEPTSYWPIGFACCGRAVNCGFPRCNPRLLGIIIQDRFGMEGKKLLLKVETCLFFLST